MGKGVMLRGKEQENIYPVTSSDLVYNPVTKKNVKAELSEKVEEAPMDGKQYARMDGVWAEVEAGAVSETVLITITPALNELHGVDVMVTTNEGDTVLDTPWAGAQLSCQVRAGLQYTVSVGAKDGFIAPEPLIYTAVKGGARTINMSYIESRLKVSILSNQENDETIEAVNATVKYGSTTVQVPNGGTVNLPQDVDVTITFPSVDGYKTPDAITYHHDSGGYEKSGTYQTELVKVTLSASNGASVNGQIITINGVEHTWNGTAITQKVAFGTTYYVVANEKSGYNAPSTELIEASQGERNVELVYEMLDMTVSLVSGEMVIYHPSQWNSRPEGFDSYCLGVLLRTENVSILIFTTDSSSGSVWGDTNAQLEGVNTADRYEYAIMDFDGENNTDAIISELGDIADAAICARNTFFDRYKNIQGYLGSAGEWQEVLNNIEKIQEALNICGGSPLDPTGSNAGYWTSTQSSQTSAWRAVIYGNGGNVSNAGSPKTSIENVRAFAKW